MPMRRKPLSETLGNGAVVDLIDRARQGDATVLPELRKLFDRDPTIWQQAGDLGRRTEAAWVNLIAGTDVTLAESLGRQLAEMKLELGGSDSTPLERLLIERIAICWLAAMYSDLTYAEGTEVSLGQAGFLLRRQTVNHERLNSALKTLAQVRKLLPGNPVPQNIEPRRSRSNTTARSQLKKNGSPRASTARRSATPAEPPETEAAATGERRVDEIDGSQAPLDEDRGGDRQTGNSLSATKTVAEDALVVSVSAARR